MNFYSKLLYVSLILLTSCISKSKRERHIINEVNKDKLILTSKSPSILYPTSTTGQIIAHKYYTLSYSEEDEQAEWVAYKIISRKLKNISRTNDFREDPYIKTGSSDNYDYQASGYDRGHLAPAKTMSLNEISMSESFYMSNMSPQVSEFNRGIWKRLEEKVRYWAEFNDSIYVVTGPILYKPIGRIGENSVTVPQAFYKTLLGFNNGEVRGIAFIMPNQKSNKSIYSYLVSIDKVEEITGIDFYYNLDNQFQNEVEENTDLKGWLLSM